MSPKRRQRQPDRYDVAGNSEAQYADCAARVLLNKKGIRYVEPLDGFRTAVASVRPAADLAVRGRGVAVLPFFGRFAPFPLCGPLPFVMCLLRSEFRVPAADCPSGTAARSWSRSTGTWGSGSGAARSRTRLMGKRCPSSWPFGTALGSARSVPPWRDVPSHTPMIRRYGIG